VEVLNLAGALEKAYSRPAENTASAVVNGTGPRTIVPAKKRVGVLISGTGKQKRCVLTHFRA